MRIRGAALDCSFSLQDQDGSLILISPLKRHFSLLNSDTALEGNASNMHLATSRTACSCHDARVPRTDFQAMVANASLGPRPYESWAKKDAKLTSSV